MQLSSKEFRLHWGCPLNGWRSVLKPTTTLRTLRLYEQVSSRVMKFIRPFADKVEQMSIDEAYLEVTNRIKTIMADDDKASVLVSIKKAEPRTTIRNNVSAKENITCSIGVADSKIIAKIATDMNKPNGLTIIKPIKALDVLTPLDVARIPGVEKCEPQESTRQIQSQGNLRPAKDTNRRFEREFWKKRHVAH